MSFPSGMVRPSRSARLTRPNHAGSPWLAASVAGLFLCCAVELLWPVRPVGPAFITYLGALSLTMGMLHGALWTAAFALLRRLPRALAFLCWIVASEAATLWLASELGAFSRLHSRYWQLAISVLAGCAVAGLAFGLLCCALQPTAARPKGLLFAWSPLVRIASALLVLGVFVGLELADRRLYPDQYALAHQALRVGTLWCAMIALALLFRWLPRLGGPVWVIAFGSYAACVILLDASRVSTLNTFDSRPWAGAILAASRSLLDFDRDGHTQFLGDIDCAPLDPHRYPGAREIPDNGIDENCILGDATARTEKLELVPVATEPPPIDVVLITADAWNPAHIGTYNPAGYGPKGRNTTPNLDQWAQHSTVFERAYSPGGWTSIAVPSFLRGVYPRRLKWRKYFETNRNAMVDSRNVARLAAGEQPIHMFPLAFGDPHPTIGEMMRRRGYNTIALTDDGYSAMMQRGTGIERGFDTFRELDTRPEDQHDDEGTANTAIGTLKAIPESKRFFMWVHFFGTHYPDTRHAKIRDYGPRPTDNYDHEVAFLDTQMIRLLDAIAQRKQPVAVIVTADHSEGLNAFTRYHGDSLDEPVIRIPMFARVPGWPTGHVSQVVSAVDLVPTILGLAHSPIPRYLDGIDLATVVGQPPQSRVLFSDTWRYDPASKLIGDYSAAYDGTRKFVLDRVKGQLYVASQSDPKLTERLVGMAPTDGLSGSVYAYSAELGTLQLSE